MRRSVLCLCLLLIIGCASSSGGRYGTSRTIMHSADDVWYAVLDAVQAFGARVVSSNRTAGLIIARIDADSLGSQVRLDISVRRPLDNSVTISVSAFESAHSGASAARTESLRMIEEDLLDLIESAVLQSRGRFRR